MIAPIALTCGEPAGVGPEISIAARQALQGQIPFFWIGDPRHLPSSTEYEEISAQQGALDEDPNVLPVLPHVFPAPSQPGVLNPSNAQAVIDVIILGVELVQSGAASALCTNPIHKKVLHNGARFLFPGHTEFLSHLAGDVPAVMMLASQTLKVVPTTIHIALQDVPSALSADLLRQTIEITRDALIRDFGIPKPRIAVSGLNPHAGEGGAIGSEEVAFIGPLLASMRADGVEIAGPKSADTMFHASARHAYDAAVTMYHDQALIPIKTLAFDEGVNVTLGLPFVRTSPDHGTALDIAGQGSANPSSLIEALKLAHYMAKRRARGSD